MDNFDIQEWKLKQILSEGEGADLSFEMINLIREKGKSIASSEEKDIFFSRISEAFKPLEESTLKEEPKKKGIAVLG